MKNKIFTLALVFAVFFAGNLTAQENDSFIKSDDVSYRALACMDGATFEQPPTTPAGGHTSNSVAGGSGYLFAQKMVDYTEAVDAVRFFGLKLFHDGSAWQAMHDADPYEFIIKLYEDEAGLPDTEIEEFVVSLNSVNTGVNYATTSYLIFYWDFVPTTPISSLPSTFWISVQNTNPESWFIWISQTGGVSGVASISSGSWVTHAQTGMGICIKGGIQGQTYEITFDAADGEGGEVQTVAEGVVPTPPDVTREGYAFAGWTPEIVAATEDATYTAQWTIYSYEITFDAADGEGGTVLTVDHGETPTAPTVTRAGYTFMGWTPEIVAATEDATYTAQWTINTNGGIPYNKDTNTPYTTIQAAIDETTTLPGHTIVVPAGTYAGFTDNKGVKLDLGTSPGCATVTFMTVTNTTTFIIDIAGDDPCTGYDQWKVEENLNLNNAQIEIKLTYTPAIGKVFTIFEYGSLTGELDTPLLIEANGSSFILNYGDETNKKITLTTVAPVFKMEIQSAGSDR